jgi:signal transduction histidine kinase
MSATPPRVLVVEDSPTQAEELRYLLSSGGFDVDVALSGEAALQRLGEEPLVDAIISDIVMPGISGYELCRRLKHDPRWKDRPVLLLTSLTDPIDVVHALESGADSFLTKPCEADHLIGRINALLESHRLRAGGTSDAIPILFRGEPFVVEASKAQVLDLLLSTFEDMVRKNDELVAARDALAAKHEELVRIERQKEELSALVVHDLKSPAAGIMMAAQAQLRRAGLTEADRTLWSLVFTSAQVINRMVLNLLDIASSADGVFAPRPVAIEVPALVHSVHQLMTPLAESLGQRIEVRVADGLPTLHADPELLRRVLQNLLDNAVRHSPRGTPVVLEVTGTDNGVVFRVRDRGPGVPAAMRDRIFDKYVRLPQQQPGGTSFGKGLGLAFSRIAVEAHGGRIWVEDNAPQGSIFAVLIPAADRQRGA